MAARKYVCHKCKAPLTLPPRTGVGARVTKSLPTGQQTEDVWVQCLTCKAWNSFRVPTDDNR